MRIFRRFTGVAFTAFSLSLFHVPALAEDAPRWTDDTHGCKIWDPLPVEGSSVTWTGSCVDGYAEGQGALQWSLSGKPSDRVEGTMVHGKVQGRGSATLANGARYEGEFSDGEMSGTGVMTWRNGNRYEGALKNGKPSGKGVLTLAAGGGYEGEFIDGKLAHPEPLPRETYSIREDVTGSHIGKPVVTNISVPVDKPYAELTREERLRVKSQYESMAEDDEPPYPLHGLRPILEAAFKIQKKVRTHGELVLAVTVDSEGHPTEVAAYKSPDKDMTRMMASVLMVETYKPAVCNLKPCKMQFPFRMQFQ